MSMNLTVFISIFISMSINRVFFITVSYQFTHITFKEEILFQH